MESLFVRAGLYAITWRRGVAGGSPAHRFADGGDATCSVCLTEWNS